MPTHRHIGVLLAAGRGRRMGATKQLAIWQSPAGPKPLVAAAYDAISSICDDMIVVLGHEADAVAAALTTRSFQRVLSDPDAPMFESIRAGLRAAQTSDATATIVLHPADHPSVLFSTLTTLTDWSRARPSQAILPEIAGRGGHPALIPSQIASLLIDAHCPTGLGDFWRDHADFCLRIAIDDPFALRDVDTPADL